MYYILDRRTFFQPTTRLTTLAPCMFPRVNDSDLAILNTYFNYNNNDKSFTSKHNVNDVKYIWNNSFWTAVVGEIDEWSSQYIFQFKQLERRSLKKNQGFNGIRKLLKLENLLRWSLFTFIYNRSSKRNYFIILHIISLLTRDMNSINWPHSQCVAS